MESGYQLMLAPESAKVKRFRRLTKKDSSSERRDRNQYDLDKLAMRSSQAFLERKSCKV